MWLSRQNSLHKLSSARRSSQHSIHAPSCQQDTGEWGRPNISGSGCSAAECAVCLASAYSAGSAGSVCNVSLTRLHCWGFCRHDCLYQKPVGWVTAWDPEQCSRPTIGAPCSPYHVSRNHRPLHAVDFNMRSTLPLTANTSQLSWRITQQHERYGTNPYVPSFMASCTFCSILKESYRLVCSLVKYAGQSRSRSRMRHGYHKRIVHVNSIWQRTTWQIATSWKNDLVKFVGQCVCAWDTVIIAVWWPGCIQFFHLYDATWTFAKCCL